MMAEFEQMLFTVGVFKDIASAELGIEALKQHGFTPEEMSLLAKDSPEAASLVQRVLGGTPAKLQLPKIGPAVGNGTLLAALGEDLGRVGVAGAMRRVGFQPHDGLIYETLTERGGICVAVGGAPRVADALQVMYSYGGGNAAIGAWGDRV
jgi:hypothetical protein